MIEGDVAMELEREPEPEPRLELALGRLDVTRLRSRSLLEAAEPRC